MVVGRQGGDMVRQARGGVRTRQGGGTEKVLQKGGKLGFFAIFIRKIQIKSADKLYLELGVWLIGQFPDILADCEAEKT